MPESPLVNEHFNDFPIDYFKIRPEDFIEAFIGARGFSSPEDMQGYYTRATELYTFDTLSLDENGYLAQSVNEKIDFEISDTTVINCAVGQGKTTAILGKLKSKYDSDPDAIFIIAVPFVSLIAQYEKDLIDLGINSEDIFNYQTIGRDTPYRNVLYRGKFIKRVHIVTVNTLLGNAGKDAVLQSDAKFEYIKYLSSKIEEENKKAYFIFDEIHDAIANFSKEGVLQLFFWKNITYKIIILSATFNVASIPVIKYLSLLINHKIRILESERKIIREQSRLFLHIDNSPSYRSNNITITRLIEDCIRRDRTIDILCYSKNLVKEMLKNNTHIGRMLREKYGTVRKCISKKIEQIDADEIPENRFNNDFCNVGTNFKSGVSINKENHSYIIILPPKSSRKTYKSISGIFTEGINSIIQSLARQRNIGDIHVILPSPLEINPESLSEMSSEQKMHFLQAYNEIAIPVSTIETRNNVRIYPNEIIKFDQHKGLLEENYMKYLRRMITPMINAPYPTVDAPNAEEYILKNAEKILTINGFLGRDLSCYVVYSAFTNQFYNARLAGLYFSPTIIMDTIVESIEDTYNQYMDIPGNSSKKTSLKYREIRNILISRSNSNLEPTHLRTVNTKIFDFLTSKINLNFPTSSYKYLSSEYNNFQTVDNIEDQEIVNSFNELKRILDASKTHTENFDYFKDYSENPIYAERRQEIYNLITLIKNKNPSLKLSGAKFFRDLLTEDADKKLYNYLVENLYRTERYQPTINRIRKDYRKIIS